MIRGKKIIAIAMTAVLASGLAAVAGCGSSNPEAEGKTVIRMLQYKPEAADIFAELAEKFNETHDDIYLQVDSPNDAMTILKTQLTKEDYPDIIGIGGDINYSYFLDSDLLMDISDFDGLDEVKEVYQDIAKDLEFVPEDGTYAMPYMANAAGVLYNKDMFEEHNWKIPKTWDEFTALCEEIQDEGVMPLVFGYRDTWTCLAPWNALAVDLAPVDVCAQVNAGNTTFADNYREVAEKQKQLLNYTDNNAFAYNYNDACTAFARGQAAMYTIGSYAIPQIQSVNPDINIDSFVMPGSNDPDKNYLNSGNDLQFSVMAACENKDAAYEVLRFFNEDENVQMYVDDQSAVPCKEGDFTLPSTLDGMKEYIENNKVRDFQDHHYPSEMAADAMIQTFLGDNSADSVDTFLARFDKEWPRYNRDIIREVQEYYADHPQEGGE